MGNSGWVIAYGMYTARIKLNQPVPTFPSVQNNSALGIVQSVLDGGGDSGQDTD